MARISGVAAFFIIIAIVVVFAVGAWIVYTHLRARRLGLPQPTLSSYNPFQRSSSTGRYGSGSSSGGIVGWVKSKVGKNNNRQAGGAYEEPLNSNVRGGRASNRGFGPLDPDEAWDARVGTEADAYGPGGYYEERELGLHGPSGLAPTPGSATYGEDRGRALSREPEPYIGNSQAGLDSRYDEEMGRPVTNPFDDSAEVRDGGLRGVSPRPVIDTHVSHKGTGSGENSPTSRKSIFRENV